MPFDSYHHDKTINDALAIIYLFSKVEGAHWASSVYSMKVNRWDPRTPWPEWVVSRDSSYRSIEPLDDVTTPNYRPGGIFGELANLLTAILQILPYIILTEGARVNADGRVEAREAD